MCIYSLYAILIYTIFFFKLKVHLQSVRTDRRMGKLDYNEKLIKQEGKFGHWRHPIKNNLLKKKTLSFQFLPSQYKNKTLNKITT